MDKSIGARVQLLSQRVLHTGATEQKPCRLNSVGLLYVIFLLDALSIEFAYG